MYLLVAADTYLHHPRNFFGFKKKNAQPELRLVATAVGTTDGEILHAAQYKTKIQDDPSYSEKFMLPEHSYGKPRRTGYNLDDMLMEFASNPCDMILFSGNSFKVINAACERVYGRGLESITMEMGFKLGDFDDYLVSALYSMDHKDLARLSGADYFASAIPLSPVGYSWNEVKELWESCCGRDASDVLIGCRDKVIAMKGNYIEVVGRIPNIAKSLRGA